MNDKMMKLMKAKQGAMSMSEPEKNAKMSVLKELHKMASDAMTGKLKGVKKVEVASDSPQGLEEGLDKAKHLISNPLMEQHFNDDTNEDHGENEMMPEPDEEHMGDDDDGMHGDEGGLHGGEGENDEDENMPEHELDAKLEKLMALKKRKGMR